MKELCFSSYKYEHFNLMNIKYFSDFASLALQSEEERMEKFIQEGFENIKNIKEDITLEEYKNYLDQGSIPEEYFYGKARFYHDRANYFLDKVILKENLNQNEYYFMPTLVSCYLLMIWLILKIHRYLKSCKNVMNVTKEVL